VREKASSPDNAKNSVVEVVEAESSGGEKPVESILQELSANS
jgi:hypothetical protein